MKDFKKQSRGTYHVLQDRRNKITLTRWNDNNIVNCGTNIENNQICLTKGFCKRWSRELKNHVNIDQPTVISLYNQGMGGVDLFDQMRGLYRIRIRSKKWYWQFIRFCLNASIVNMWILYRFVYPQISLLQLVGEKVENPVCLFRKSALNKTLSNQCDKSASAIYSYVINNRNGIRTLLLLANENPSWSILEYML